MKCVIVMWACLETPVVVLSTINHCTALTNVGTNCRIPPCTVWGNSPYVKRKSPFVVGKTTDCLIVLYFEEKLPVVWKDPCKVPTNTTTNKVTDKSLSKIYTTTALIWNGLLVHLFLTKLPSIVKLPITWGNSLFIHNFQLALQVKALNKKKSRLPPTL